MGANASINISSTSGFKFEVNIQAQPETPKLNWDQGQS